MYKDVLVFAKHLVIKNQNFGQKSKIRASLLYNPVSFTTYKLKIITNITKIRSPLPGAVRPTCSYTTFYVFVDHILLFLT